MASTWADKYAAAKDRTPTSTPLASKLLTPKTPEQIAAEKTATLRRDNLLQSQVGRSNTFTQGGQTQVRIRDYNQSGAGAGETATPIATPKRTENTSTWHGRPSATPTNNQADVFDTMETWENLFGDQWSSAETKAQSALDSEVAGLSRRSAELNAVSGRSAAGGGYQSGAAQAALSAGSLRMKTSANFAMQRIQHQTNFLQRELDRALRAGQFDKAQQLELALAQIDMSLQVGETDATSDALDDQYTDYTGTKSPGSYGGGVA